MHALRAGDDLLATNENVVGVGVPLVILAGHGVEGPHSQRVAVQDVEVCTAGSRAPFGVGEGWQAMPRRSIIPLPSQRGRPALEHAATSSAGPHLPLSPPRNPFSTPPPQIHHHQLLTGPVLLRHQLAQGTLQLGREIAERIDLHGGTGCVWAVKTVLAGLMSLSST